MQLSRERLLLMKNKVLPALELLVFLAYLFMFRYFMYRHLETKLNADRIDVKAALEPFEELRSE